MSEKANSTKEIAFREGNIISTYRAPDEVADVIKKTILLLGGELVSVGVERKDGGDRKPRGDG